MAGAAVNGVQFEIERWALAALAALQADTNGPMSRGHYAARAPTSMLLLPSVVPSRRIRCSRRSIADRARDVGLTSTQLTHYFRRYVGESRINTCAMAARGVRRSLASGLSVSETCYRSGFENLSHFCRTFQRTFCIRASAWHTLTLRERRRKVQDLTGRLV